LFLLSRLSPFAVHPQYEASLYIETETLINIASPPLPPYHRVPS
jgi:hypothetical protein